MKASEFFGQLRRRNVYKVAVAYAAIGWLVMQVTATVVPALHLPDALTTAVVVLVLLGLPIALVIAWAFEMTPEGMKRTENLSPNEVLPMWSRRKFAAFIIVLLLLAGGLLALQHWPGRRSLMAPALPLKSIAILPFESLSDDKANSYFAEGIHDEILTRLAKIADLKVISRFSTEQYQSKPGNLAEIARQLGVAHILEGSVQKAGDAVRVSVQLIKANENSNLWADTYDRKLTDIFAVETEVAERIAGSLAAQLTGGERQQIAKVPTANPQAYDAYLRGLALIRRQAPADVKKGRDFLQRAVELDPLFAQAWAQISVAESQIYFDSEHTSACLARSQRAAETAVRLQPELSEARAALGLFYYLCLQDYDRALVELNEARQHSPNDGNVIFFIGLVKRRQGKLDEAIELLKQATVFDPRNQDIWANLAGSYRGKRDFPAAREAFDRAFALSPDETDFAGEKAETYLAEGDLVSAEKILAGQDLGGTTAALGDYISLLIYKRRFQEAIQVFTHNSEKQTGRSPLLQADDKSWLGSLQLMVGHETKGRELLSQARTELEALRAAGDTNPRLTASLLLTYADLSDRAETEKAAAMLLSQTKDDLWRAPESEIAVAIGFADLGDADRAIPLVRHALSVSYRRAITRALLRLDPVWDPIRSDPRFQELTNR